MNTNENNASGNEDVKKEDEQSVDKSKDLFEGSKNNPEVKTDEVTELSQDEKSNESSGSIEKNTTEETNEQPPIEPVFAGVSTIAVVRNDGQNKITILSGNMRWKIERNAQIPLTSVPSWVKQHPEFQAFRKDKILIYTSITASKQQF